MQKIDNGLFPFYRFENLSVFGEIVHFVASGEKNIGFTEGTDYEMIRDNRMDLGKAVGFEVSRMVCAHQIHSDHITVVKAEDRGKGALDKESRLPDTDGMITDVPGVCLLVLSADCVPVLLYDPVKRVIGAIHAGWRGTVAGIAGKAVAGMRENYGCCPADIIAGIGPSIGRCCFEVGPEVADVFREKFGNMPELVTASEVADKFFVDLWMANFYVLTHAGVSARHIEISGLCTRCRPDEFFSYRYAGKQAGRFGAGIVLCEK